MQQTSPSGHDLDKPSPSRWAALRTNPWLTCLLPFVVFMLIGSFEPAPPDAPPPGNPSAAAPLAKPPAETGDATPAGHISDGDYPLIYTAKIALTLAAMLFVLPGYRQMIPLVGRWRVSFLAIAVGAVGVMAWVGLAALQRWNMHQMGWNLGLGTRSAFNPLEQLAGRPALAYGFLAIRLFGLAILVPVFEEFFLRAFVMRFPVETDWWRVPFGRVTPLAVILGTVVPVFLHPAEAIAAAVWFSGVTWLMLRTRNIWDCILAHAVTNLLLGVWVVISGQWWLM
jgi:hypothetical protein